VAFFGYLYCIALAPRKLILTCACPRTGSALTSTAAVRAAWDTWHAARAALGPDDTASGAEFGAVADGDLALVVQAGDLLPLVISPPVHAG